MPRDASAAATRRTRGDRRTIRAWHHGRDERRDRGQCRPDGVPDTPKVFATCWKSPVRSGHRSTIFDSRSCDRWCPATAVSDCPSDSTRVAKSSRRSTKQQFGRSPGACARGWHRIGRCLPASCLPQSSARATCRRDSCRRASRGGGVAFLRGCAGVPRVSPGQHDGHQCRDPPDRRPVSGAYRQHALRANRISVELLVMQSSGGVFPSTRGQRATGIHGRIRSGRRSDGRHMAGRSAWLSQRSFL